MKVIDISGLIEVKNLVKDYKLNANKKGFLGAVKSLLVPEYEIKRAVDNISFTIHKGDMVGFIGPNGAGKSTTVKMLSGILVPTSGEVSIDGLSPYKDRKKNAARIGVVFGQKTQLWWDLPVIDTFSLLKHVYRIPNDVFERNLEQYSELLGLNEFMYQPVRQISLGQRMRADIAAALLHDPDVIFFDEPTIGLDISVKDKIRNFLKYINTEKGITMLFTTHDMKDIERVCNKIIIIDKGRVIYNGLLKSIRDTFDVKKLLIIEFQNYYENLDIPGLIIIKDEGKKKWLQFERKESQLSDIVSYILNNYSINDLNIVETDIEEIIREIYEGGIAIEYSLY